MTTEEAKEFLNQGYRAKVRIQAKKERIVNWRQIAESITTGTKPDAAFSSLPSKKIEDCACNIVDLQKDIQDEINALIRSERTVSETIAQTVEDPTLRTLLELRYLNYLTWEEIAVRLNITFRWTLSLHKKALELFVEKAC